MSPIDSRPLLFHCKKKKSEEALQRRPNRTRTRGKSLASDTCLKPLAKEKPSENCLSCRCRSYTPRTAELSRAVGIVYKEKKNLIGPPTFAIEKVTRLSRSPAISHPVKSLKEIRSRRSAQSSRAGLAFNVINRCTYDDGLRFPFKRYIYIYIYIHYRVTRRKERGEEEESAERKDPIGKMDASHRESPQQHTCQ